MFLYRDKLYEDCLKSLMGRDFCRSAIIPAFGEYPSTKFSSSMHFQGVGHEWTLGGRFSFTQLSPLSPGYQRHGSSSCLAASGMTYACNLPYADEETEVSAVVAKKVIPEILQVSAMYSFLYWSSSSSPEPTDPIEQRLILAVQLAF